MTSRKRERKEKKEWRGEDKNSTDRYDFTDYLLSAVMN